MFTLKVESFGSLPYCFQESASSKIDKKDDSLCTRYPAMISILKMATNTAQAGAVGYCAWSASVIANEPLRNPDEPLGPDFYIPTLFATAFLIASFASICFGTCKRDIRDNLPLVARPIVLVTAACLGVAAGVNLQYNAADKIWNSITAQNTDINARNSAEQASFYNQIEGCYSNIDFYQQEYTNPNCSICPSISSTKLTSLKPRIEVPKIVQYAVVPVNQTLCEPSSTFLRQYWSDFGSYTANTTDSQWPCDPDYSGIYKDPKGYAAAIVVRQMLWITLPFSITATPVFNGTTPCFHVEGFGSRPFYLDQVCRQNSSILNQSRKEYLTCITQDFMNYADKYTATFKPYTPLPTIKYPGIVSPLIEGGWAQNEVYILISVGGFFFMGAIATEIGSKKNNEQKQVMLKPVTQEA